MVGLRQIMGGYRRGKNGTRTNVIEEIRKPDGNYIKAQVEYGV